MEWLQQQGAATIKRSRQSARLPTVKCFWPSRSQGGHTIALWLALPWHLFFHRCLFLRRRQLNLWASLKWTTNTQPRNSPSSSYLIRMNGDCLPPEWSPECGALLMSDRFPAPCYWGEELTEKEDGKTPTDLLFLGGWLARWSSALWMSSIYARRLELPLGISYFCRLQVVGWKLGVLPPPWSYRGRTTYLHLLQRYPRIEQMLTEGQLDIFLECQAVSEMKKRRLCAQRWKRWFRSRLTFSS